MVPGRSRFGVFLLMLAAAALCLGLFITTPSDAQTRAGSQNARVVAGGDDCIAFEDEASEDDADAQDANTEDADTEDDAGLSAQDADGNSDTEGDDEGDTTDGRASQDVDDTGQPAQDEDNVTNQQVQSQNESSLQVQNDNTGVFQQSVQTEESDGIQQPSQTEESGDVQQALEAGEEDGAGLSMQDEDDDNQALQNGDEDDDGTDDSEQETQDENGEDENGDEDDECVIAETVPDEPLLPTGAPAKSGSNETAKDKSGGENQSKSGSKKQVETERKTEGKTGGKQADSAKKRTGGGKKLEVQDRGKKIEVEDRSGKTPRQEKSGSRTSFASSNDAPLEKARPENPRSENPRSENPRSENPRSENPRPESARSESSRTESDRSDPGRAKAPRAESVRASDLAPRLAAAEWASPSREEVDFTKGPRRFAPDPGAEMTLSTRALRLYNVPIANSNRLEELDRGLVRMPDTSLPWDAGDQRNVFVAGHYLGLPETQSRMVFYNLDKLKSGDEIVLKDSLGQTYKYRVSEKFAAGPEDSWVMGQVRGRDMLTLQTCIPPDFGKRLVVRADRVQ